MNIYISHVPIPLSRVLRFIWQGRRPEKFLAEEHPVDADVVIGVPDSGLDAAMGYAEKI